MTDTNTIRVIPFCDKVEEWPIWSERFLAKAKRCGFKDLLLGKLLIPKVDEEIDETSDIGSKSLSSSNYMRLHTLNSFY
jgi:hypothetical protein